MSAPRVGAVILKRLARGPFPGEDRETDHPWLELEVTCYGLERIVYLTSEQASVLAENLGNFIERGSMMRLQLEAPPVLSNCERRSAHLERQRLMRVALIKNKGNPK